MFDEYVRRVPYTDNMAMIGYQRVSTPQQKVDLQTDALLEAGCDRIFTETASGKNTERPQLHALLDYVRVGDTVVVWKLDRLGRSLTDLIRLVNDFQDRGVEFMSVTDGFDTSTPGGRLVFHIFASLAEFERSQIQERTRAGLAAARARGVVGGRHPSLNPDQAKAIHNMLASGQTISTIARTLGTSRATVYRHLAK